MKKTAREEVKSNEQFEEISEEDDDFAKEQQDQMQLEEFSDNNMFNFNKAQAKKNPFVKNSNSGNCDQNQEAKEEFHINQD